MKYFPFKILIVCIFLPPVLYIASLQSIERYLHARYAREIENSFLGDTRPLLSGNTRLKDALAKNINHFLQTKKLLSLGVKALVTVNTKRGEIIYPPVFEEEKPFQPTDPMQVAAANYNLMNEGLLIDLKLNLSHNTLLSNAILAFYILISVCVLNLYYRKGMKKAQIEELEKEAEISRLQELEKERLDRLASLEKEKKTLAEEYDLFKDRFEEVKKKADSNEDEMIEEIVSLEDKISENLKRQQQQQDEIAELTEKLSRYEKGRPKTKAAEALQKRFKAIYKNISIQERALNGFVDLTENMKIKAEEIIHQLDQDPALVPVKRKVFGKKGRETVLEVVFAYKGRLYYRRLKDNRVEIITIGTKNVQAKDLEFLDKL